MRDLFLRAYLPRTLREEEGQGMVEYALIIVFVALAVIAALALFGPKVANLFNTTGNSLG